MPNVASFGTYFCKLLEMTPTCRGCSSVSAGVRSMQHILLEGLRVLILQEYGKRWFGLVFLEMLPSLGHLCPASSGVGSTPVWSVGPAGQKMAWFLFSNFAPYLVLIIRSNRCIPHPCVDVFQSLIAGRLLTPQGLSADVHSGHPTLSLLWIGTIGLRNWSSGCVRDTAGQRRGKVLEGFQQKAGGCLTFELGDKTGL